MSKDIKTHWTLTIILAIIFYKSILALTTLLYIMVLNLFEVREYFWLYEKLRNTRINDPKKQTKTSRVEINIFQKLYY